MRVKIIGVGLNVYLEWGNKMDMTVTTNKKKTIKTWNVSVYFPNGVDNACDITNMTKKDALFVFGEIRDCIEQNMVVNLELNDGRLYSIDCRTAIWVEMENMKDSDDE